MMNDVLRTNGNVISDETDYDFTIFGDSVSSA